MKNSILIISLILSSTVQGQISFEQKAEKVDSLNTASGENYLVIHPTAPKMAYTEEGRIKEGSVYRTASQEVKGGLWETVIFQDDLADKSMVSPIGFTSQGLIYNEVSFAQGLYSGAVKVLSPTGKVSSVRIPYVQNRSPVQSGCISHDGKYMVLSLEASSSVGVEDLYVVKKKADGSWSKPSHLGYQLNTAYQEVTPFLAEDNRTLFFATNGRGGAGSFDLFYAVRQDESWRSWSEPVNLGTAINTSGSETSFCYQDGAEYAFFISSQDSDAYGDVMTVPFKEEIDKTEEPEGEELDTWVASEVLDQVFLKVVDRETNQPVAAQLLFDTLTIAVENGDLLLDSALLLSYSSLEIKAKGYLPVRISVADDLQVGVNQIPMDEIKAGATFTLENVLFHRGTAHLKGASSAALDLVVEMMEDNPSIKILLKGHTDNTGDPIKNVQLSEERVKAVKSYLLDEGVSPYRVRGKGYGGNDPIASNATEETRQLNRRVEFEVIEE